MHKILTLILAGLSMVGPLAIDAYLPSFPAIGQHFAVSPLLMQQTLSVFLFTFAFMMLFYGTLSDSFGRRPVILISLVVYTLASAGAALAPSFGWLLVCRALQGLSAGAGTVVGRAIVQDRFSGAEAQRIVSQMMMVFGLAPALAPVIGGWLHVTFGWRATFVFLALFSAMMLAICWRSLPESLPKHARDPFRLKVMARNYWKVLRHPQFLLLALAVGIAFSGFGLYIGSAANFVMNILHLPETAFGWMFIPLVAGLVLGSMVTGKLSGKVGTMTLVAAAYAIMGVAAVGSMLYNHFYVAAVPWAVVPLFVYSFGLSLALAPLSVLGLEMFPDNRGLAASLQAFVQTLCFAIVSGLVAPLLFDSAFLLACGVAAALVVSLVCLLLARPGRQGVVKHA
jgi:DHA1 family bicyclomycin/chloramphenicol resistance-like MFS transporter